MIEHPRILCLFSTPLVTPDGEPLSALDIGTERDAIVHELSACRKAVLLRIGYATVDELARGVAGEFNILHLSCHGEKEYLLFEDGKGGSQPVGGDYLRRLIRMGGPFELAIVSACHSERMGEILVEAGIKHVVAIKCDVPVLDVAAIAFISQFFRSLFEGDSVGKAFEMATLLVEGNPQLMKLKPQMEFSSYRKGVPFMSEEKKFVLLPDDSTAHLDSLISHEITAGALLLEEPASPQSNLPVKPQSFAGRSVDMYDIINELYENRLVTITGAGGIGKTVVAVEVARWFCSRNCFSGGTFYIDLRQTHTLEGMVGVFGAALGVKLAELKDVIVHLRDRHCLLLLDNAEDILWKNEDEMQDFMNNMLKFTPNTRILVTSQRPVGGNLHEPEHVYRMYPLERDDAALLFIVTARRKMEKEEWESQAFCSLLEQLAGHPLSIVLTACQLMPGVILEDLIERISVYKARAITVKDITDKDTDHGESLVASLASAYDTLSENARTLFEILAMLPAGAQEEMLSNVFGDAAWKCVQELNEASLVEIRERRATLLPPVRLFALNVATEEKREMYGPKIMKSLEEYAKKLYEHHGTGDAKEYRSFFSIDEPNLRSAVDLPCPPPESAQDHSILGLLGPRLVYLYSLHNRWKEAREVGGKILSNLRRLQDQLGEAETLLMLGIVATWRGELGKARSQYETALTIYQHIGYGRGEANVLSELGNLSILLGEFEKAHSQYETALGMYQSIGEQRGEAHVFVHVGDLSILLGEFEKAHSQYETALRMYQSIGYELGEANTLKRLGDLAVLSGEFEKAHSQYETALRMYRRINEKTGEASTLLWLGQWAALVGDLDHAEIWLDSGLALCRETEHFEGEADAHMVKALIFLKRNNTVKGKHEIDYCSSIQDKVHTHCRAARWLVLYAVHLRLHGFREGAKVCSEYAEAFASKTQNEHLQNKVKQQLTEVV